MRLRIPPPIIFIICAILIYFFPREERGETYYFIAIGFALAGSLVAILGMIALWQKRTTLSPINLENVHCLVVHGIYNYTRNPMYLGLSWLLVALVFWGGDLWGMMIVWLFRDYLTNAQIIPEEQMLQEKFGDDFLAYQQRVPRWFICIWQ